MLSETPDEVRPAIEQALQYDGAALVEAIVCRQELSMPPTITLEQMKGFTHFSRLRWCSAGEATKSWTWRRPIFSGDG
jgi:hypothetical protein